MPGQSSLRRDRAGAATPLPAGYSSRGELALLQRRTLALFCSIRCPGNLVQQTYALAIALRDAGVAIVGGFHSPMEQECLARLLEGNQPVIICPARSLDELRLPADWQAPLAAGRLLLLSPFSAQHRRVTASLAARRNAFVAAVADEVFIAFAAAGSRTEAFARQVAATGTPLATLNCPENAGLIALGAEPIDPRRLPERWLLGDRRDEAPGRLPGF